MPNNEKIPFIDHVSELRRRLIYVLISLVFGVIVGYFFQNQLLDILVKPLGKPLFYTSPIGGFEFLIKIWLLTGTLVALPMFMYQLVQFVKPAIEHNKKVFTIKILLFSFGLLIFGIGFAYFVSLPATLYFLSTFGPEEITSLITTNEYFSFVIRYLLGFGLLFQLPALLLLANKIRRLDMKFLMKQQKIALLGSFIFAAVITPTGDPLNQAMLAIPLVFLYEFSILLVWLANNWQNSYTLSLPSMFGTEKSEGGETLSL